jgi:hypothetical protein
VPQYYSAPLSADARTRLIAFVEAYIETVSVETVDKRADVAKAKAIECLQGDIDILNFITVIMTMHSESGLSLVMLSMQKGVTPHDAAVMIVDIFEKGRHIDISRRTS